MFLDDEMKSDASTQEEDDLSEPLGDGSVKPELDIIQESQLCSLKVW